ncbi:MAG: LPS assembly protein LptD, partial [Desulfobulbaceae bacterium]|nr:LPS assembly protein LptD [Desulfobulbaceae bacterium]
DLNSKTGTFYNSTIFMADTHMFITGDEVVKTGDFTYDLKNGTVSACRAEEGKNIPWIFKSSRAKLTVDGMARLTNVHFVVDGGLPLFYTPFLTFPAKTKRETGFLFPEWSHSSRDGFGFMTPFFVNISPSSDVTLYPGFYDTRGMLYGGQYRYVAAEGSHGNFMFSHLRDRLVEVEDGFKFEDDYKRDNLLRRTKNRYWLRGKADHDFGNNLIAKLDLDLVSDQDYLQELDGGSLGYEMSSDLFLKEFSRDLQEETISARESSLQFIKSWSNMVLTGEFRNKQDTAHDIRLGTDDGDGMIDEGEYSFVSGSNTSPLQVLPRIEFNGRTPVAGTPLSLAWDSEYVHYWRDQGLSAHRLDLHPQLITSLPAGGWFEGMLTGGLRETKYQVTTHGESTWAHDRFQERLANDFTGNIATTLLREFDLGLGSADWLEHMVRPNLLYEYVTRTQEKDLPSFDGADRLAMKNWLTWELNNYFGVGGAGENGDLWNRNFGTLKILQTYNLQEARREIVTVGDRRREWSDLRFEFEVFPVEQWQVRYQTNLSMYDKKISRYELVTKYSLAGGHSFAIDYEYLRNSAMAAPYFYTNSGDSRSDIEARFSARLTDTVQATGYINKSFSTDHTVESAFGLTYKPHCWMVEFETTESAKERRVMIIFSLDGIGRAFRWGKGNV